MREKRKEGLSRGLLLDRDVSKVASLFPKKVPITHSISESRIEAQSVLRYSRSITRLRDVRWRRHGYRRSSNHDLNIARQVCLR